MRERGRRRTWAGEAVGKFLMRLRQGRSRRRSELDRRLMKNRMHRCSAAHFTIRVMMSGRVQEGREIFAD
eukprot:1579064-Pleurochrysis_carterae.AAC.1